MWSLSLHFYNFYAKFTRSLVTRVGSLIPEEPLAGLNQEPFQFKCNTLTHFAFFVFKDLQVWCFLWILMIFWELLFQRSLANIYYCLFQLKNLVRNSSEYLNKNFLYTCGFCIFVLHVFKVSSGGVSSEF